MNKKLILASMLCLGMLVGCGGGDGASSQGGTSAAQGESVATSTVAPEATKATMEYKGDTTQMLSGTENNAALVSLDAELFTVTASAGTKMDEYAKPAPTPLFPRVGSAKKTGKDIRIYNGGGAEHGIKVTMAEGYTISTVEITYGSGNTKDGKTGAVTVRANGANVALVDGLYTINSNEVFFGNDGDCQTRVSSFVISYSHN